MVMPDIIAFFRWWLLVLLAGWLTWPLVARFLPRLPDRAYSFSKAFGLLLIGYTFWILSLSGYLRLEQGGVLVAAAIVIGVGMLGRPLWLPEKGSRPQDVERLEERQSQGLPLHRWAVANWRTVLVTEAMFLLCFGMWAYIRALNPEIVATEKPMEFALLNSILRTDTLLPQDPWLSGYAISYYYFGYVIIAMLTKMSGVLPSVGFNLGIALLFGLTAVGSFGVVLNLILLSVGDKRQASNATSEAPEATVGLSRLAFPALLAPVFTVLVGNLNGLLEVLHQRGLGPPAFWRWLGIKWLDIPPVSSDTWLPQRYLWWWQSSRVIRDVDLTGTPIGLEPIDEFPFFSFLLGDMHPHVLALPFVFMALAIALQLFLGWGNHRGCRYSLSVPFSSLLFYAVALGGLSFLNTWDFPIYLFVAVSAYVAGEGVRTNWGPEVWPRGMRLGILLTVLGVLCYLPFYLSFRSQASGILPNAIFPTRLSQFVVMFGPVLIPTLGWLTWTAVQTRPALNWGAGLVAGPGVLLVLVAICSLLIFALVVSPSAMAQDAARSVLGSLDLAEVLPLVLRRRLLESLGVPLLLTAMLALAGGILRAQGDEGSASRNPVTPFILILLWTGALLTLGPEFVYLRDTFGTRLNTVFKLYYQAWVLWSVVAAYGVWQLGHRASRVGRALGAMVVILVLAAGLVYPALALWTKTEEFRGTIHNEDGRIATLDGMAAMANSRPDDYQAIHWLNHSLVADGVISEAVGGSYTEYSRVSTHTGLATVLGWPGHELQWRGGFEVAAGREDDIRELYSARSWSKAVDVLGRYDIRYVYIGPLEKANFPASGLTKFEEHMRAIYRNDGVTIYERID